MSEYCTNLLIKRIQWVRTKYSTTRLKYTTSFNSGRCSGGIESSSFLLENSMPERAATRRSFRTPTNSHSIGQTPTNNKTKTNNSLADEQKRYIQLLNEVYEIAQIFPNVLDIYFRKLNVLFPNPSENISYLLNKIRTSKSENSSLVLSQDLINDLDNDDVYQDKEEEEESSTSSLLLLSNSMNCCIKENKISNIINNTENTLLEMMINNFDNELRIIEDQNDLKIDEEDTSNDDKMIGPQIGNDYETIIVKNKTEILNELRIIENNSSKIESLKENADYFNQDDQNNGLELSEKDDILSPIGLGLSTSSYSPNKNLSHRITHDSFMNELKNRMMDQNDHPISSTIRIQVKKTLQFFSFRFNQRFFSFNQRISRA
jgi:hypothetical protein